MGGLVAAFSAGGGLPGPSAREARATPAHAIAAHIVPSARIAEPGTASVASSAPGWQIQVGAYGSPTAARAQLRTAATAVPELASLAEAPQSRGGVTRARFAGAADEAEARRLCRRVAEAGAQCFVVAPGG